jgi:A/G-specific adenine glycosylase
MSSSLAFQQQLQQYYAKHWRELPWRTPVLELDENGWLDPYKILLSEIMLQQTQVSRVIPKYELFLRELPTLAALSAAPFPLVLQLWSGLGYNRRAKYLHDAARQLADTPLPWTPERLTAIKGIGPNTAAAICVYAFDQPHVFIETNIRSVFLHHFSEQLPVNSEQKIHDKDLLLIIEKTLDRQKLREFYWALMDYGSHLKRIGANPSRASAHHTRQSRFAGSRRQLRGEVLRYILAVSETDETHLASIFPDERLGDVIGALLAEGLLMKRGRSGTICISGPMLQ